MIVTNLITVKIKPTIIITRPESIRQFLTPWCTRTCPPCSAPCNPSWCPPPSQPWSSAPSDHTWDISTHPSILARSKNRVFIKFSLKSLIFKLTWFRLNSDLPEPQLTFTWPGPGPEPELNNKLGYAGLLGSMAHNFPANEEKWTHWDGSKCQN